MTVPSRSSRERSQKRPGGALATAIVMPLPGLGKLRIAKHIGSAALKADAACSVTCAYMSLALLIGLLLNRIFGWWWADPLAGLAWCISLSRRDARHSMRPVQGKPVAVAKTIAVGE